MAKVKNVAKNLFSKSNSTSKQTKTSIKKKIVIGSKSLFSPPLNDFCTNNVPNFHESNEYLQDSNKIFGKVSEVMKKKGIIGYEWSNEPELNTFNTFEFHNHFPKLNSVIVGCEKPIDFFNFFFNDLMFDYIVLHTNEKLKREKLIKPSNTF